MRSWPALDVTFPNLRADDSRPDLLQAALMDFAVAAIDDNTPDAWRVFFYTPEERARAQADLAARFDQLEIAPADVPDEDWAARSQADLHAIQVGRIVVAPPWDLVITIQPSMGFGTGHHATTRLCLAALQQFVSRGQSAIDVGTGSGVLAIAASLLGAWPVLAIDDDPDAIRAARENVVRNAGANVDTQVRDVRVGTIGTYDIVVANLTGGLLVQAAARLRELTSPGGRLILSGLLNSEEAEVRAAFAGCAVAHRTEEDEWICLTLTP